LTCINQLIGPTPIIESVRQLAEQNCYPCLWTCVTYLSGMNIGEREYFVYFNDVEYSLESGSARLFPSPAGRGVRGEGAKLIERQIF
jgi:hypothetical protein